MHMQLMPPQRYECRVYAHTSILSFLLACIYIVVVIGRGTTLYLGKLTTYVCKISFHEKYMSFIQRACCISCCYLSWMPPMLAFLIAIMIPRFAWEGVAPRAFFGCLLCASSCMIQIVFFACSQLRHIVSFASFSMGSTSRRVASRPCRDRCTHFNRAVSFAANFGGLYFAVNFREHSAPKTPRFSGLW